MQSMSKHQQFIRRLFGNYCDNPYIFRSKLRILMKIGINIEQTTSHNFTKLNLKKLTILFFTVPKLVDDRGNRRRQKLGD